MPLMSNPKLAPRPVPTTKAVGVARPRAQGQAITSVLTKTMTAISLGAMALLGASVSAMNHHTDAATKAATKTTGTKTAEIRSTRR